MSAIPRKFFLGSLALLPAGLASVTNQLIGFGYDAASNLEEEGT
jgi:hypothetical protein